MKLKQEGFVPRSAHPAATEIIQQISQLWRLLRAAVNKQTQRSVEKDGIQAEVSCFTSQRQ